MEHEAPTRTQPALHTRSALELKEVIRAERAGAPFVVWRDGEGLQHIVALPAGRPLTVGRRATNDIAIVDDPEVSRVHAQIESIAGDWAVADDGLSSNGTFIGEERILGRRRLNDGDVIRVGRSCIEYRRPITGSTVMTASVHGGLDLGGLSERQRAILVALARPYKAGGRYAVPATNAEVAREVHLSLDAVKGHLKVLYARFEIAHLSRNEKRMKLVQLAVQLGIVTERDL
jgi:FHA domain